MLSYSPFDAVENNVMRKVMFEDALKGVLIGAVPSLFLGSVFSIIYAIIELLIYICTENKIFAYASLASFLIGIAYSLFAISKEYEEMIHSILHLNPA